MNLQAMLGFGRSRLTEAHIADAAVDAWELLEYVCDINKNYFYMHPDEEVPDEKVEKYKEILEQRTAHIPLQQLTGYTYFMGLKLFVNEHVLIPRFDTEVLVEQVLKLLRGNEHILDMCTGSGCILLSLLHERPSVTGVGADVSEEALKVARENACRLDISAEFMQSDLFSHISGKYDIIVSNPPYIASEVIQVLEEEVRCHEPMLALDGMEDGLYFYRRIISEARDYLKEDGYLCFEIGFDQGDAVSGMMQDAGYKEVKVIRDLSGLDRVVIGGK